MGRLPLVILAEIVIAFVLVLAERIKAVDRTQNEDKSYAEDAENSKNLIGIFCALCETLLIRPFEI